MSCTYGIMPNENILSTQSVFSYFREYPGPDAKLCSLQLEALLYQLAVLSFLMSPSILALVTRTAAQFQLSKPSTVINGRGT